MPFVRSLASEYPVQTTVKSATRSWNDANNDFIPQEGELGPLSNSNFGRNTVATRYSPDVLLGFGNRDYIVEVTMRMHELLPDALPDNRMNAAPAAQKVRR